MILTATNIPFTREDGSAGNVFLESRRINLTGSRAICPQVKANDTDYIVLVHSIPEFEELVSRTFRRAQAGERLSEPVDESGGTNGSSFVSLRGGDCNLIVTESEQFFESFSMATRVAAELGLTAKAHRILLFQAILYSNG